ncbi:MAG: hypothetical protein H8K06_01125 [Nitrospira sp.]|uniref:Uncharacterized protein n=1 Tax=Nitrospira defluvii TaxID=330214 RepID=A0ABN7L1V9_9BACT|nr:hypothetical protein [Nitrospira defluvii]MCS6325687.1 hypothetical protein [Nitrospira sp.]CAE6726599.1 conserved hypothetical protein [Nitrospira defluvii]
MRFILLFIAFLPCLTGLTNPDLGAAAEKSYYSPIINVDVDNGRILISTLGAVFWVEVPEEAKAHIEKLPQSGLVDIVVETREGQPPMLKTWKVKSGESTCLYFDGKVCK